MFSSPDTRAPSGLSGAARREYKQNRIRDHILDAAALAFQENGLAQTRLRDIADRAGYTVSTLYSYFRNKQAIADALFAELNQELAGIFSSPPQGASFEQSLELFLRQLFELSERRRGLVILVIDLHERPQASCLKNCAYVQDLRAAILDWLGRHGEKTALRWSLEETGHYLFGLWYAHTALWILQNNGERLMSRAAPIIQMALHGILKDAFPI